MIDAVQPDVQPATQHQTYPHMAVVSIQTSYDLVRTRAMITYRKFGIDLAGRRVWSPYGPFVIEVEDFDGFAMARAQAGDLRWAQLGTLLMEMGCGLANEREAQRLAEVTHGQ